MSCQPKEIVNSSWHNHHLQTYCQILSAVRTIEVVRDVLSGAGVDLSFLVIVNLHICTEVWELLRYKCEGSEHSMGWVGWI